MKVKITEKAIAAPTSDMTFLVVQTDTGAESPDVRRVRPEDIFDTENVFWATYGTTTSAEIEAAYQAEMVCLCAYNGLVYRLAGRAGTSTHVFACTDGASIYVLNVLSDSWIPQSAPIPSAASSGAPVMDGIASRGSSTQYARADHVHPTDTSRAAASDLVTKADKVTEVTVSTAGAVTQALDAEKIYHFTGALTSLTLTLNAPASGQLAHYHFDFLSGATAPTLTMPNTVTMPSGFTVEASKHYEIDILNGYGAVAVWAN